jgi:hypothetical protein
MKAWEYFLAAGCAIVILAGSAEIGVWLSSLIAN